MKGSGSGGGEDPSSTREEGGPGTPLGYPTSVTLPVLWSGPESHMGQAGW